MAIPEVDPRRVPNSFDPRPPSNQIVDVFGGASAPQLQVDLHAEGLTLIGDYAHFFFELTQYHSREVEVILDTQFGSIPLLFSPAERLSYIQIDPVTMLLNGIEQLEADSQETNDVFELHEQISCLQPFTIEFLPEELLLTVNHSSESDIDEDSTSYFEYEQNVAEGYFWHSYKDEETGISVYTELTPDTLFVQIDLNDDIAIEFCLNRPMPELSRLLSFPTRTNALAFQDAIIQDI